MKTNPSARKLIRVRSSLLCLGLLALAAAAFILGESLGVTAGRASRQNQLPPAPTANFGQLIASAR